MCKSTASISELRQIRRGNKLSSKEASIPKSCESRTFAAVVFSYIDPPSHSTSFIFSGRAATASSSFIFPHFHAKISIQINTHALKSFFSQPSFQDQLHTRKNKWHWELGKANNPRTSCSSAATSRRHCFSHRTLHHSVWLYDRL